MQTYNKLKELYQEFHELKVLPYIEFSHSARGLLVQTKDEIKNYYFKTSEVAFKKYSTSLLKKLNQLIVNINKISIDEIKQKFDDYEYYYNFEEYSIESILNLDPESDLYLDLSFPINKLSNDNSSEKIYSLQEVLLKFSKVEIVNDVIDLMDSLSDIKNEATMPITSKYKFHGTQTEFIELIKALVENGNLKGVQKDIINDLSAFFDIEIKHPNKLIQDIRKRNIGSETLFLDKLNSSLSDFITRENRR